MLWKILYSPYDAGALIIMVLALAVHLVADRVRAGRTGGDRR